MFMGVYGGIFGCLEGVLEVCGGLCRDGTRREQANIHHVERHIYIRAQQ